MSQYVDLLVASPSSAPGASSVFSQWRQAITRSHLEDKLLLQPGETVDAVPPQLSEGAVPHMDSAPRTRHHAWPVQGPGDWLFLKSFVLVGSSKAIVPRGMCARRMHCPTQRCDTYDRNTIQRYWCWTKLRICCPTVAASCLLGSRTGCVNQPEATPRDTTGRPGLDPSCATQSVGLKQRGPRAGAGAGTGAGVGVEPVEPVAASGGGGGAAAGAGVESVASPMRSDDAPSANKTETQRGASQTGLLGCLLHAAGVYWQAWL